jgi:hypothetical protein
MKLTIHVDDELYRVLKDANYVPVLRVIKHNEGHGVLCSLGEAIANIKRRDLDEKLPTIAIGYGDVVLYDDGIAPEERAKIVKAAHELHAQEGVCEIDDNAEISDARADGGDDGVYVQGWLWVPGEDFK